MPLLPVATLICLLIMLQPDLGTTLVIVYVVLALLWVVGAPARLFAGVLGAIASGLVTLLAVLEPYRLQRLTSFADPFGDAQDTGYQAVQGLLRAVLRRLVGPRPRAPAGRSGPTCRTPTPTSSSRSSARSWACSARCWSWCCSACSPTPASGSRSAPPTRSAGCVAAGITAWLIGQALINMGAVVGLLPITGIPLPLISFGGSSLVPTLFAIGIAGLLAERSRRPRRSGIAPQPAAAPRRRGGRLAGGAPATRCAPQPRRRPGRPAPGAAARRAPARPAAAARARASSGALRRFRAVSTGSHSLTPRLLPAACCRHSGTLRSVVLAGGGTAGHVEPALAVADALRAADPDVRITLLGTEPGPGGPARARPAATTLRAHPRVPLPRQARPATCSPCRTACGRAVPPRRGAALDRWQADVVVGFGGYVAVPRLPGRAPARLPIVVHEANPLPGLANRVGARLTRHVAVSSRRTPRCRTPS